VVFELDLVLELGSEDEAESAAESSWSWSRVEADMVGVLGGGGTAYTCILLIVARYEELCGCSGRVL
jgi:hypothetical protein